MTTITIIGDWYQRAKINVWPLSVYSFKDLILLVKRLFGPCFAIEVK